jgi:hypothetical protein
MSLLEKRIVQFAVEAQHALVPVDGIRRLEPADGEDLAEGVNGGLEDGEGIAANVDEAGIGEQFQQQLDASRVGWGFEDEGFAVLEREFFGEEAEALLPPGQVVRRGIAEGEESIVVLDPAGEGPAQVGRAKAEDAEGKLILPRPGPFSCCPAAGGRA